VAVVPPSVPPERAVLAASMETALNGIWDSGVTAGDRVTVVGGGTIGCLVAYLASRIVGTDVTLCDINSARAKVAHALGVRVAPPAPVDDRAAVVEMSWYGAGEIAIALGGSFHSRRLTLRSSQVGEVATRQRPRWSHRRRMELALSLLGDARLDVLLTGESDFESLPETMRMLAERPGETLFHRVRY
jgi:Zn-dependent alcohol dehydrogenase